MHFLIPLGPFHFVVQALYEKAELDSGTSTFLKPSTRPSRRLSARYSGFPWFCMCVCVWSYNVVKHMIEMKAIVKRA